MESGLWKIQSLQAVHPELHRYEASSTLLYRAINISSYSDFVARELGFLSCSATSPLEKNCLIVYPRSFQTVCGVSVEGLSHWASEREVVFCPSTVSQPLHVFERRSETSILEDEVEKAMPILEDEYDFGRIEDFDALLKAIAPSSYHKKKWFDEVQIIIIASLGVA